VSIGAVDEHGSLAGAVYIPALNEMFTAVRGGGAFCNGQPIRCNPLDDISKALVCTGFSYAAEYRTVQATRVSKFIHQVRDIRRFGAASIDMCFVACGRFDAYFEENLHSWDIAAGDLIAREAGCQTGDFAGNALRPAQVLVSNPNIFSQLGSLILTSSTPDR
jgi:myo-inositol-1(or 4)-monophosphatase